MRRGAVLILLVAAVAVSGCGDEDSGGGSSDEPKEQAAAQETPKPKKEAPAEPDPQTCLIRAGVSEPEKRGDDVVRGFTDNGILIVRTLDSPDEAARAVKAATDVEAGSAGPYFINGGQKSGGSAQAVETVADCIKNG